MGQGDKTSMGVTTLESDTDFFREDEQRQPRECPSDLQIADSLLKEQAFQLGHFRLGSRRPSTTKAQRRLGEGCLGKGQWPFVAGSHAAWG